MWGIISWIIIIAGFAGLIVAGLWYYKTQLGGTEGSSGLFGARAEKRLAVVEQSNVDGRRKLVLIRRDDVEHLIMTGGPVDVVIETNILDEKDTARSRQSKLRSRLDDTSRTDLATDNSGHSRIPPTL